MLLTQVDILEQLLGHATIPTLPQFLEPIKKDGLQAPNNCSITYGMKRRVLYTIRYRLLLPRRSSPVVSDRNFGQTKINGDQKLDGCGDRTSSRSNRRSRQKLAQASCRLHHSSPGSAVRIKLKINKEAQQDLSDMSAGGPSRGMRLQKPRI